LRLLLATRSTGKSRELRALLSAAGHDVVDLREMSITEGSAEEFLETEPTFEGNALAKARHFFHSSGIPTLADDSGIEVEALGSLPGVISKRWSGRTDLTGQSLDDANNALLISKLQGIENRAARYVCAAAFCDKRGEFVERGDTKGEIIDTPRGGGGFGYDPYFLSDELGRTFAEVTMEQKSQVSHRARAFAKLLRRIAAER
jgi:XTP/dITP diphosphohydrolase